jgi:hypothetical protein
MTLKTKGVQCLRFSDFHNFVYIGVVGPLDEGSARLKVSFTYTEQHKHRKAHMYIYAMSGIWTCDPNVRAVETLHTLG